MCDAVGGEIGKALQELSDCDAAFQPRQREARADMRAGAEGEMAVRRAGDIECVRAGEDVGIAVGGADAQRQQRAFGSATPPSSVSIATLRLPSWFELSKRKNSSIAVLISDGSSISRCR